LNNLGDIVPKKWFRYWVGIVRCPRFQSIEPRVFPISNCIWSSPRA